MNEDTEVIYGTILQVIGFAENALVAIRRGETSAIRADIGNARRGLETAVDLLTKEASSRGCEKGHTCEKASACTDAGLNAGLSLSPHS